MVVTIVSSLVHVYSIGYMADDPSNPRFLAYLSLFTFSMLMLVTADNLAAAVLRLGRRRPRLLPADRLLVRRKPSANAAAIKAFIVNRVGDFGFVLGIVAVFLVFGTHRVRRRSSPRAPSIAPTRCTSSAAASARST